jgi:integrase
VHLFRHLAAKLILDRHPEAHELARRVLGHASIETTTQAYVGMESKSAGKAYDDIVLAHRHRRPIR